MEAKGVPPVDGVIGRSRALEYLLYILEGHIGAMTSTGKQRAIQQILAKLESAEKGKKVESQPKTSEEVEISIPARVVTRVAYEMQRIILSRPLSM
jgi:hypothetical protein